MNNFESFYPLLVGQCVSDVVMSVCVCGRRGGDREGGGPGEYGASGIRDAGEDKARRGTLQDGGNREKMQKKLKTLSNL